MQNSASGDCGLRPTVVLSQLLTSSDRAALAAVFTDETASPGAFSQTAYATPHTNINKSPSLHLLLLMQSLILPSFRKSLSAPDVLFDSHAASSAQRTQLWCSVVMAR